MNERDPGWLKSGIVVFFIIFPSKGKDFAKFVPFEGKLCGFTSKMSRKAVARRVSRGGVG